jgi:hypothetical protein
MKIRFGLPAAIVLLLLAAAIAATVLADRIALPDDCAGLGLESIGVGSARAEVSRLLGDPCGSREIIERSLTEEGALAPSGCWRTEDVRGMLLRGYVQPSAGFEFDLAARYRFDDCVVYVFYGPDDRVVNLSCGGS